MNTKTMHPELILEKNTKIAEICGWTLSPTTGWGFPPGIGEARKIPNYLEELGVIPREGEWSVCHTCGGKGVHETP